MTFLFLFLAILFGVAAIVNAVIMYRAVRLGKRKIYIIPMKQDDEQLEAAKAKALSAFGDFTDRLSREGFESDRYHFYLKKLFEESDIREHMWVRITRLEEGVFYGTLSNDPGNLTGLKYGDEVLIKADEIEDWQIIDVLLTRRLGGFSRKAILKKGKN